MSSDADRLVTSYDKAITYDAGGNPLADDDEERLDNVRTRVYEAIRVRRNRTTHECPLYKRLRRCVRAESRLVDFIISSEIEQEYSGSATKLSAHWYDHADEFDGHDALFTHGFGAIPEYLAKGLSIKLGEVVREVVWGKLCVRVITQNSEYEADHIVVTLPLGVLQSGKVAFIPELPRKKKKAIAAWDGCSE